MEQRSFGTHDGSFHADEVSACALLLAFDHIDRTKIYRTRDPKLLKNCEYVCDVGGVYDPSHKRFDHHQMEYNGSLSSAGMVWLYLKEAGIVDPLLYEYIENLLIRGVDAHDNGKALCQEGVTTFSHIVASFVPIQKGNGQQESASEQEDRAFFEAVSFAFDHLKRLIDRFNYIHSCKDQVEAAMASQREALIFDDPIPWQEAFFQLGGESHPAQFVIMPAHEHWKLRVIPPSSKERMGMRKPLPKMWAGLRGEKLAKVSGVKGAVFCHKGRFISIWETKADALKALNQVLKGGD